MSYKMSPYAILSIVTILVQCASIQGGTLRLSEDFDTGPADWRNAAGTAVLNHVTAGGPDGGAYASGTFDFAGSSGGQTPVIFRAQDEFGSSGGLFEGNWISDGVMSFSVFVRHNVSVALTFFVRFAGPSNYPGATAVNFAPVQPDTWTRISFPIDPNNSQFIGFEGTDFSRVFSNIGHVQIGVNVPPALAGANSVRIFDVDKAMLELPLAQDAFYFVDPNSWDIGDSDSTYQEWDVLVGTANNRPDLGHVSNPASLPDPNLRVYPPGFVSSSANFYSFNGDYSISVDIYNHGGSSGAGAPAGYGTHVIIQTAATVNRDPNDGGPASVLVDSVEITDFNDAPVSGGSPAEALRVNEIWRGVVPSSWGDVTQQELIWEFFLPDYTGDFRVRMDNIVHSMFKQIRIDSRLATKAYAITPAPGPYDLDSDGDVDFADLALFIDHWQQKDCTVENNWCGGADFDRDGSVDMDDLTALMTYFLQNSSLR